MIFGPDVYEGSGGVDWGQVRAAGATFGICKAAQYRKDNLFDANWQGIKNAGLVARGAYHFLITARDIGGQAALYADTVGPLGEGDFGPIIDYEQDPDNGNSIPTAQQVGVFVEAVTRQYPGKRPIIYGNAFDLQRLRNAFVDSCDLWIAAYGANNGNVPPNRPSTAAWGSFALWQYTSVGQLAGIPASCDISLFDGPIQDFHRLIDGKEVVQPMFNPPLQIVAWCQFAGGVAAVAPDGAVFCEPANAYQGGANGKSYFIGRQAAEIQANARGGYDITDTAGETYSYPEA